jgi:Sigma-70, region 4
MSTALLLAEVWGSSPGRALGAVPSKTVGSEKTGAAEKAADVPATSLAFYRRHTERMLQRYLYASMQVGRAPSVLGDPVGRGWVSSRPIRTFEEALVFVLDVERCISRLEFLDRLLLSRIVLQAYTHEETAALLGMAVRTVSSRLGKALDRLTERLLETGLLVLPD